MPGVPDVVVMAARHQVVVRGVRVRSILEQICQTDFIVRLSFPGQRVLFKNTSQNVGLLFQKTCFVLISSTYLFLINEPMADLRDLFVVGSGNDEVAEPLDGGGLDIKRPVGHGGRDAQPWRGEEPSHLAAAGAHCSQFLTSL